MCTEIQTPTSKVHHREPLRLPISTRGAKSVIIKLKQWMKKLKSTEHRAGGVQKSTKNFEGVLIDRQNATNENKSNIVKSKMAYTVEELRDIVEDNLANELKEIEAKSARE